MTFSTPHPNVAFQGSLARTRGAAPSQGDEGHSSLPSPACQYRPSRGVLHLAFKPLLRTSQNSVMAKFAEFPFRNCLEIRNGSRIGAQKAAKRGQRSPDQLPLGAIEGCSRCLLLFSKQFRKVNSANFVITKFSEVASSVEFSHKLRSLREERRGASWIGRGRELRKGGVKGDERDGGVAPE